MHLRQNVPQTSKYAVILCEIPPMESVRFETLILVHTLIINIQMHITRVSNYHLFVVKSTTYQFGYLTIASEFDLWTALINIQIFGR